MPTTPIDLFTHLEVTAMKLLTPNSCPAFGGISVEFYFDDVEKKCWLELDVVDNSSASSKSYVAEVPDYFVHDVKRLENDFDPYNSGEHSIKLAQLAENALSRAFYYQKDTQKSATEGGFNVNFNIGGDF